jgi:hypothetical protein
MSRSTRLVCGLEWDAVMVCPRPIQGLERTNDPAKINFKHSQGIAKEL